MTGAGWHDARVDVIRAAGIPVDARRCVASSGSVGHGKTNVDNSVEEQGAGGMRGRSGSTTHTIGIA